MGTNFLITHTHRFPWSLSAPPSMQELQGTRVWSLGQEDPLEEVMATHSNILSWWILWTEESGRLHSIESQRVGHDWSDSDCTCTYTHMHMHVCKYLVGAWVTYSMWRKFGCQLEVCPGLKACCCSKMSPETISSIYLPFLNGSDANRSGFPEH